MKVKSIFALAVLGFALVACGPKVTPVSEQLVGHWVGQNEMTVTVPEAEEPNALTVPVELEYLSDSTFTAQLFINDSTTAVIGAQVKFEEDLITFEGTLACSHSLAITGTIVLEGEVLVINYKGVNEELGIIQEGRVTLNRKVVEVVTEEVVVEEADDEAEVVEEEAPAETE